MLLHSSFGARVDSNYASSDRQPRQNGYRGNYKFQVPSYLSPDAYAQTTYSTDRRSSDGTFSFEYETDNAIKVKQESTGYGPNKVVRGYYSYVGDDGITYTTNYIADRFGYRAYGAHLPTQPDTIYNRPVNNQYFGSSTPQPPIYNRPANNQFLVPSTPQPPAVYPLNPQNHQHHTQTVHYPVNYPPSSIHSRPIYVAEPNPSNYVTITPRPFIGQNVSPSSNILPPYNLAPQYGNPPPYAWTTVKPPTYNSGPGYNYGPTTPRPFVSY